MMMTMMMSVSGRRSESREYSFILLQLLTAMLDPDLDPDLDLDLLAESSEVPEGENPENDPLPLVQH